MNNASQCELRERTPEYSTQQHVNVNDDAWFKHQVQIGLDAANAGQLMSSEEVEALFAVKRATTRSQLEVPA